VFYAPALSAEFMQTLLYVSKTIYNQLISNGMLFEKGNDYFLPPAMPQKIHF
jgi:hypothetical protein